MGDALAGRVVLVTGSSRGIGAEVAAKAAGEGATVAVHYHRAADGGSATLARVREAGANGETFAADLEHGDEAQALVEAVIDRFGRIDGLVNNAGITQPVRTLDISSENFDAIVDVNLRGNWLSNRVFASARDIVNHCCDAWNKLIDRPWTIMSIGLRDWAHGF